MMTMQDRLHRQQIQTVVEREFTAKMKAMKPSTAKMLLTKEIKALQAEVDDLEACKAKGWDLYLGEPLMPRLRETKRDLKWTQDLRAEISKG